MGGINSKAQQNRMINHIKDTGTCEDRREKVEPPRITIYMNDLVICTEMKTDFQMMLMLLGVHSKCLVSSIGKARLPKCWPTVVLVNDLSCLGVFDTCRRLAQQSDL